MSIERILAEIAIEQRRAVALHGEQNHLPDGTGRQFEEDADDMRRECQYAFINDVGTWRHILREEVYEALAETDAGKLRTELVQVGAVCASWIAAIDSRTPAPQWIDTDNFTLPAPAEVKP